SCLSYCPHTASSAAVIASILRAAVQSCNCSVPLSLSFPTRRSADLFLTGRRVDHLVLPFGRRGDQHDAIEALVGRDDWSPWLDRDRKSTRLNSSHVKISYAVFCLKKKKNANFGPTISMSSQITPFRN